MIVDLKGNDWRLCGVWPYTPILKSSVEVGIELKGVMKWIDASIPGSVHSDLIRAGVIKNPYFELNSIECEWVENRWWVYKKEFEIEQIPINSKAQLVIEGIDYYAYIYLNGEKLDEHECAFIPFKKNITSHLKKKNELIIIIKNAPDEMSQIGLTSKTKTQKSRFCYKWDFSTRMVNLGVIGDIYVKFSGVYQIENFHAKTIMSEKNYVSLNFDLMSKISGDIKVVSKLFYQDTLLKEISENILCKDKQPEFSNLLEVQDPKLWYPSGYGEQNLYKYSVEIYSNNILSDKKEGVIGFRNIKYIRCDGAPGNALKYSLSVNGKRIYIKGANLVPLDHMYGSISYERYETLVKFLVSGNFNLIRIWGGGLIESKILYELCDSHGILIWQEFIQSSSGIDNVPCTDKNYLDLLEKTSVCAVKEKRNHTCLAYWSGGNELTDIFGVPVTYENENIKMLKNIVSRYDYERMFLPTSASGPLEFLRIDKKGKNHDVHGPWKYLGTEEHYQTYNNSDSMLQSEFGVDGMSSLATLEKFLSKKNLKVVSMKENLVWTHHGEWWDTLERDEKIFGKFENLENFIRCSQFIQGEGLRYGIESNRRRIFQNAGSIIWQLNEPWPNVSNTCVLDYYNHPKKAYHYVKVAFEPLHVSMAYDKLIYKNDEKFVGKVYLHNDLEDRKIEVTAKIFDENERMQHQLNWDKFVCGDSVEEVGEIIFELLNIKQGFYICFYLNNSSKLSNSYLFFTECDNHNKKLRVNLLESNLML